MQIVHLRVLLQKNAITYRRSLAGSASEIVFPLMAFLLLVLVRYLMPLIHLADSYDIQRELKSPFYPVTQFNPLTDTWESSNSQLSAKGASLEPFLTHSDYRSVVTEKRDNTTVRFYSPFVDYLGPLYLFPGNCWLKELLYFNPVIAYIQMGGQIERDIVAQLGLIFDRMKDTRVLIELLVEIAKQDEITDDQIALLSSLFTSDDADDQADQRVPTFGFEMLSTEEGLFSLVLDGLKNENRKNNSTLQEASEISTLALFLNLTESESQQVEQILNQTLEAQLYQLESGENLKQIFDATSDEITVGDLVSLIDATGLTTDEQVALLIALASLTARNPDQALNSTLANQPDILESFSLTNQTILGSNATLNKTTENVTDQLSNTKATDANKAIDNVGDRLMSIQEAANLTDSQTQLVQELQKRALKAAVLNFTRTYGTQIVQLRRSFDKYAFDRFGDFQVKAFSSERELDDYLSHPNYGYDSENRPGICMGFQLTEYPATLDSDSRYDLALMFNDLPPDISKGIPEQNSQPYDIMVKQPNMEGFYQYAQGGYLFLESLVANTILRRKTQTPTAQIVNMVTPTEVDKIMVDSFQPYIKVVFSWFMVLGWMPVIYRTVYQIVDEKNSRAKEAMRIMGMKSFSYWLSWYLHYSVVNALIAVSSWGVLCINMVQPHSRLFLLLILWLFGQSLFGVILLTQSFSEKPKNAAMTASIFYFGITTFQLMIENNITPRLHKLIASGLVPMIAMQKTIQTFVVMDNAGLGITMDTWDKYPYEKFKISDGIWTMVAGGATFIIVGIYAEIVGPKTYGKQMHPLFFLGCPWRFGKTEKIIPDPTPGLSFQGLNCEQLEDQNFEMIPPDISQQPCDQTVRIQNLRKTYADGFKAVQGIDLTLYSGQIFVLIGHNGAGKSTTISMLTGMTQATQGQVQVFGNNFTTQLAECRKTMGICPQYDVLFDKLTVQEHLSLFYDLKQADRSVKAAEIAKLIADMGLSDKKDTLAYQLSGGNKRKLSVAIALCGQSKFVLLDEPTSGMDLTARRQMWDLLKEYKRDRVILLTTHNMEEADILGDRIGIISKGRLTCVGTSHFLKNKFGSGYDLNITKTSSKRNTQIVEFLHNKLGADSGVRVTSEIQNEMTIKLPQQFAWKFGEIFRELDESMSENAMVKYSVTYATLEEVYLKVGNNSPAFSADKDDLQHTFNPCKTEEHDQSSADEALSRQGGSFCTQFGAVLQKRARMYKNSLKQTLNEIGLPLFLILVGCVLTLNLPWRSHVSPDHLLSKESLPLPQRILVNPNLIIQNVNSTDVSQIYSSFPKGLFEFGFSQNYTGNITEFSQQVTAYGQQYSSVPPYMYGSFEIYEADRATHDYKVTTFTNLTARDSAILYTHFIHESILKVATNEPNLQFNVETKPYPRTNMYWLYVQFMNSGSVVGYTAIIFSVMLTPVISYLVLENMSGLRHQQNLAGMKQSAYWLGNLVLDFVKLQFLVFSLLGLNRGFGLIDNDSILVYFMFPFAAIPYIYVVSHLFSNDNMAQTVTYFFNFFIIAIGGTTVYAIRLTPQSEFIGDVINFVMKTVPTYPISDGVYCDAHCENLALIRDNNDLGEGMDISGNKNHITNIPLDLIAMGAHFFIWLLLLTLIECGIFKCCRLSQPKRQLIETTSDDSDVLEQAKISKEKADGLVQLIDFQKVYRSYERNPCKPKDFLAVGNVSFTLQPGDCFALLGTNGAGKSTTFRSLTCEVRPTAGQIRIAGHDMVKDFSKARNLIGYCPQHNLLFESLTVLEHMMYYAKLKGIPKAERRRSSDAVIRQLGLQSMQNKIATKLSGGNQRKVCLAQALLGNPPILLLDEPSAGMDPEARRYMWSVLSGITQTRRSTIVLSTHIMEEAEALSTKMAIMTKGGNLKCFGSAQHIKNKYGCGYIIELNIKDVANEEVSTSSCRLQVDQEPSSNHQLKMFSPAVVDLIGLNPADVTLDKSKMLAVHYKLCHFSYILALSQKFGQINLVEQHGSYIKLSVPDVASVGELFSVIELCKDLYSLSSYSVSQTSLEQVFQLMTERTYTEKVVKFHHRSTSSQGDDTEKGDQKTQLIILD